MLFELGCCFLIMGGRSLLCFHLLLDGVNGDEFGLIAKVEHRVLAVFGELCHEPLADEGVAVDLEVACSVSGEGVFIQVFLVIGNGIEETLNVFVGKVLELVAGGYASIAVVVAFGGGVGLANNAEAGDFVSEPGNNIALGSIAIDVVFLKCLGDGEGLACEGELVALGVCGSSHCCISFLNLF